MKAIILAGGYGKRLRPFTEDKPKNLVEINGKTILEYQINWLKKYNINDIILLAGYKYEKLIEWCKENEEKLNVNFYFSIESKPLGTGGALKKAEKILKNEEKFLMINGDIITNLDISKLSLDNFIGVISLVPLRSTYGVVLLEGNKIKEFIEKPILKEYWINAGVYLFSNKIFEYLPEIGDIEKETFPRLAKEGLLKGEKFDNIYWRSIDTLKDLEEASKEIEKIEF
ncbi:MAG: nucleotidyltransferase family protein [Nanopusillaceae archaeon]|jgi:NDP-sugar pyrophosphorylase family protein